MSLMIFYIYRDGWRVVGISKFDNYLHCNTLSAALKFSVDHVAGARMLKANWFATQPGKMENNGKQ